MTDARCPLFATVQSFTAYLCKKLPHSATSRQLRQAEKPYVCFAQMFFSEEYALWKKGYQHVCETVAASIDSLYLVHRQVVELRAGRVSVLCVVKGIAISPQGLEIRCILLALCKQ